MRRRKVCIAAVLILLLLLSFGGLVRMAFLPAYLSNAAPVSNDEDVVLYPMTSDENGVYPLSILPGTKQTDTMLVLAAMRPFTVWIDGECVYTYQKTDLYQRLHMISLPDAARALSVEIKTENKQKNLKAMLVSKARAHVQSDATRMLSLAIFGVQLAVLFVCGTLYFRKRSEKYLLAEMLAVFVSMTSTVLTSGVFPLPIPEGTYVSIQYVIDAIRIPILQAVGILLFPMPKSRLLTAYRRHIPAITAVSSALFLLLQLTGHTPLAGVLSKVFWLVTGCMCVCGLTEKQRCMPLFTFGYLSRYAMNLYSSMANMGLIPCSPLHIFFYIPQLSNMLFILPCVYIVNDRFAAKYGQAEELAQRLRETNARLDEKVEERTQELTHQQEMRRSIMLHIFHDLRSPLFAARGCADMLTPQNEEDKESLDIIKSRLDFLSGLTEQLFLAAKLEENEVTFVQEKVDVSALCQHVLREYQPIFAEKQQKALLYMPDGLAVTGDGFRLKQMLENLLKNAVYFTPVCGTITLTGTRAEDAVVLSLSDNGVGIDEEDLPHIFEQYYRGKNADGRRSSGLGLYIASDIVKKHNGEISAAGKPGEGTTFEIRLPAQHEPLCGGCAAGSAPNA